MLNISLATSADDVHLPTDESGTLCLGTFLLLLPLVQRNAAAADKNRSGLRASHGMICSQAV